MKPLSLLEAIPAELPEEFIETLHRAGPVRIERIVSRGHASPPGFWYDQAEEEAVLLLSGEARLSLAGPDEEISLSSGDFLVIPARRRHRLASTAPDRPTVWLAIFYPPPAS